MIKKKMIICWFFLFFPFYVHGQTYQKVTLSELSNFPQNYDGEKVQVEVKIKEILGGLYSVYDSSIKILIEDRYLLRRAESQLASRDNVKFWGKFQTRPTLQITVAKFKKGKTDNQYFQSKYDLYKSEQNHKGLKKLGAWALNVAKISKDRSMLIRAKMAYLAYFNIKKSTLDFSKFQDRYSYVLEEFLILGNRKKALENFISLYQDYPSKRNLLGKILQDPKGINAMQITSDHGQKWVFFEEYKLQKGFLHYKNKWLAKDQVFFNDFILSYVLERSTQYFQFKNIGQPSRDLTDFESLTKAGKIRPAMIKEELLEAWGYPKYVYMKKQDDRVIEMWIYTRLETWYADQDDQKKNYAFSKFYLFLEGNNLIVIFNEKDMEKLKKKE